MNGSSDISLDDSTSLAFQVGADYQLNQHWYVNAAVWKIDIDTTAYISANGTKAASVDVAIDPVVFMLGVGYSF